MANNENLEKRVPFVKGDPRINREGRPKLPDLRQVMADILGEEKDSKSGLQRIIDKLQDLAEKGNIKAAEVLLSRGYGLPKQHIEHSGDVSIKHITGMQIIDTTKIEQKGEDNI